MLWRLLFVIISFSMCKPISSEDLFYHNTNQIMTKLEKKIENNIKTIDIMILEIKIALLSKEVYFSKKIDDYFKDLHLKHMLKIKLYENLLNSIGLSPAREDEIYLIEEMEKVGNSYFI